MGSSPNVGFTGFTVPTDGRAGGHGSGASLFQGASALSLDAKGRMSIPARHREALQQQAEGRVTLTKHPDGCLLLFPRPEWESFRARIAALPMDAHWWKRCLLYTSPSPRD